MATICINKYKLLSGFTGKLHFVSNFLHGSDFLKQMKLRTLKSRRGGGGIPYNSLYGEAPPEGVPFSGFRYMKGYGFYSLKYTKG